MVFCRECKAKVEDCQHFVAPLDTPAVAVFDPKVKTLAYSKQSRILEVVFKDGQAWQLFGIAPDVYDELLNATLSSFLKFLARRYRAAPVRRNLKRATPKEEPCPACKRPMTAQHKTSGGTLRILWHCNPCNQSLWRTYSHESVRERRSR